jgi:uncharacterized membrane protein YfcA
MPGNDDKRLSAALLAGAVLAVALVAALTAWTAQLGGGAWLPVLAPFALVLAVPWPPWRGCAAPTPTSSSRRPVALTTSRLAVGPHARLAHHLEGRMNLNRTTRLYLGFTAGVMVGLLLAGGSLATLLPSAILVICPLMMLLMMRRMDHDGDDGAGHDHREPPAHTPQPRPDTHGVGGD